MEIAASRVALRPLTEGDLAVLEPWCDAVEQLRQEMKSVGRGPSLDRGRVGALPYGIASDAAGADATGLLAITRCEDGGPIGLVEYRLDVPEEGWLAVENIAVEPGLRGLGLGSEAVRLLEEAALAEGLASRFWAGVPKGDGLALYFWLRLGYRPARHEHDLWSGDGADGIIGMIRTPEAGEERHAGHLRAYR